MNAAGARPTLPYEPKRPRPKPTPQAVLLCFAGLVILVFGTSAMWISGNLDINRDEQQFIFGVGLFIAAFGAVVALWSGTWIFRQLGGSNSKMT